MPNCPQCGAGLDGDEPAGMCPGCLIEGAFDSSISEDKAKKETLATAALETDADDFGRYLILRFLGEGGMGTVYLAEQREPIRRQVALKVVKLGMDTSQVLTRFANERQALAVMDHPNIARIFDAGATPKGRPYFVMEFIDGVPITQFCDRNRLTIRQRLELFLTVCHAVQHAHEKGVIHRDLKPSNVLVKEQGGAPLPKVIDFGIAKATDQWAVENTLLTQFGQLVGTPEYASPEQAEVMTGAVDETSDVYSLGVLLFELLVGSVPFDVLAMRRAGLVEMLRIIREEEAPSLSRKFSGLEPEVAATVAVGRQTDSASLRRLVDGDLNRITLKALEKVRKRRYQSVNELAADIQRYLEHRPVLASPPTALYRARMYLLLHRPRALSAAAAILVLGVTVWSMLRRQTPPPPMRTEKRTIVLADFVNSSADPALSNTLRQVLTAELGNSDSLALLSDQRVRQTLALMLRSPDTKLAPDIASEICERTESAAVVEGSIAGIGSESLLAVRARNCRTGDLLDEEQAPAAKKEDVLPVLRQMAIRLRTRTAASLPPVKREPSLPTEVTTPSLEAWKSYSAAMKSQQSKAQSAETIPLLKRATEIDTQFAMAYADLGRLYASFGESELGAQYIAKAYKLRNRASDRENYYITFNYHRQVARNLELARQTLESWIQKAPSDFLPRGFLSAFTSQGIGRYDKAAEEGEKAIQIDPDYAIGYFNVTFAYIYLNRLKEAGEMLRRASQRGIETAELSLCRYFIAFLQNNQAVMEKEVIRRHTRFEAQGWFEQQEALTLAYHGRLKEAGRCSDRAVLIAREAKLGERAALFAGSHAAWSALFGAQAEGRRSATNALQIFRSRDADYGPALALALLRDPSQTRKLLSNFEKRYPEDTSVQFSYLPALRALEAVNDGRLAAALEMTQVAAQYELGVPATAFYTGAFFGALYPVYVRGLVYSRLGQYHEAAAEFQNILDHPAITLNDPIGPLARLQLARALHASGDPVKSAAVYRELLKLWQNADPDVPVVREARVESARLP